MKYTLLLLLTMIFTSTTTFAQESTKKKVVIIKKVKDENGNVSKEEIKASGEEADKLLKELKEDGILDGIDIEVEIEKAISGSKNISKSKSEDIQIEKKIINGVESTTYTVTSNDNGSKQVMVWNGDGEMPEQMAKIVKEKNLKHIETDGEQEMVFIGNGENSEGTDVQIRVMTKNKVTLGVMIDDSNGVLIEDIVEGSVAEKSGLQKGDTILKIDNQYTFNTSMLLDALNKFDTGESCIIRYIRDSKEVDVKINF